MRKLNTSIAASLSAILIFSMFSVSNAEFEDEAIVKVKVKQGRTLVMMLVKNSEDFGLDIYGFSVKLTNGNIIGFKGPRTWTAEHDKADTNTINFSTEDKPLPAGKGTVFRFRVDIASPIFEWIAFDEDGEELDSNTISSSSRGSSIETPMPMPERPISRGDHEAAISVSPERTMPSSQIKVAGKGFAANSHVEIMLDETGLARTETDSNGQFALEAAIPKDTDFGMHKVWAKDAAGNFARAVIMIGEIERPDNTREIDRHLVVKAGVEHYHEGTVVIISGYGIPESIVELEVKDPTGKVVLHERASTDMKGMFGVKMQLSTDAQNGTYVVYAKQEGQEAKSTFTVMLREKPPTTIESVLTVNTEHERYHDHDNIVIFGRAGPGTVGIAVIHGDTANIASNMVFKDEVKVSEDGSFKTVFAVNDVKEGTYVVMAHQGSITASAKFFVESSERGEHSDERHDDHEDEHNDENNESMSELKVHTDKDSYGIGETVTIYGGNADPEKRIEILIFNAETKNDRTVYKDVLTPNSDGSFKKTSPPITSDVEPGVYTVVVMQGDSGAETRFKIVT